MEEMTSWATPLLLLPGVGLLVMSTSARYARLHDELHRHIHAKACTTPTMQRLLLRASLFRFALLALYGSCSLLALSGLSGAIGMPAAVPGGMLGVGVLCLVAATLVLMRETSVSLDVIKAEVADQLSDPAAR